MDGEAGAEGCAAGTSRDSARIVWRTAYEMLQASPELVEAAGLQLMANAIVQPATNSSSAALRWRISRARIGALDFYTNIRIITIS
jgi:hypothetical protein